MLSNYFKIAWRNLINSKLYGVINIMGLATGMAVALIIGLWVYNEYSYDKFLPNSKQLYQVKRNFDSNGDTLTFETTSLKLADALRNNIPEIEYVAESDWMGDHGLMVGEKKLFINGGVVGGDFLKMFQFPLLKGTSENVFRDPYSIILNQSTATALFGDTDPINKIVRIDNRNDLKVTGVLKDLPSNSTFQFKFLVPFSYYEQTDKNVKESRAGSFGNNSYQQFVQLKPGVTYDKVEPKIRFIERSETTSFNAMHSQVIFQPLERWHLYGTFINGKDSSGFIVYVRIFSIIAMLVLIIACINFINLTTARSEKRAKEVGVRKAIGSQRKDLILQFLTESFLLTFLAFLFALVLVNIAIPFFNELTGKSISIPFSNLNFWLIVLLCVCVTGIAAGSRPAVYLSSFQPVKVLKGSLYGGKAAALPRKVLVVIQFSCSIALIISTIIVYQQIQHVKDRPTGYDINRVMMTNMNAELDKNYTALKNELLQKGIAESVTQSTSPATDIYWHSDIDNWPGKMPGESIEMATIIVSTDYFKTLGIKIQEGREFSSELDSTSVILNEAAISQMRIKKPLSQTITWNEQQFNIVGIAKNALIASPFASAEPTMFLIQPGSKGSLSYKLSEKMKTKDAIEQLTLIFNKYNPSFPYDYQFADARYAAKFNLELLIGKLAGIFAVLSIFISCLGLFGLAAYMAEQRNKEIGIRKVLGASIQQVWMLLSKDFIMLVLLSCLIASPIAFYFLQNWLQSYSYRINIGPGVFVVASVIAILITLATISFQAIRAAMANPVKSLKSE
jgi:putative ABC transport system permease protein